MEMRFKKYMLISTDLHTHTCNHPKTDTPPEGVEEIKARGKAQDDAVAAVDVYEYL
jgi:hypothetical protein